MLGALGLDEGQESAYRALVALGAAEVPDLAHRLTLPVPQTERALRHLERHGLAARSSARPGRWVATPPGVALGALLTRQRHELEQAEAAAALLAEEYRAEAAEPPVHDLLEVVTGASAVAHRWHQLRLGAVAEVCALVPGRAEGVSGRDEAAQDRPARRGPAAHRVVVERAVLTEPDGLARARAALGRGERLRVLPRVPTELVIADGSLAMVPLTARGAEPAALVVHASGLLESLRGLFEAVWREALPLRLGPGGVEEDPSCAPDATDLEILSLLLAGMTDASVAKHLELGLRTVQRRVKGLMELCGVTTRLQLGWHAYERGWVAR
ncbi:helix-turn-helix domain-containing protein [Streptomyces antimicrobicus]|uniref:Helix-turn-helix transcriptional regulator n=1 Tax=Streptomyces antimicrobicus TaxID=2883108 RepID=A0ABS8BDH4_9ACTN|nr:helix-turn-helix domain-containing protein [Streptomyces antimicrobicus]MCB5182583.1 helix-turn-helix transcriptional regulator [Streptomyces antimicrobicus]